MMKHAPALAALLLTGSLFAFGAVADSHSEQDDAKMGETWDVMDPPGNHRDITIDVEEGTWMSLDVSPDGKTIAFDMLGDIYTLPATGGTATAIASGLAWEIQPRFSPDGQRIAFTSDRAGGDNIWTMKVDGSDKQQVSDESFRLLNNPTWSPDGEFIAARKHFTTSRSLGTGEIWMYAVADGGAGVQLTKRPNETFQKEIGEPIFAPDGKSVYFSANTTSGDRFIYAQDSNKKLFEIRRYDMETGETTDVVSRLGGAVRPTPSPDGKSIAFVGRDSAMSKIYIMDLDSGDIREVFDHPDQDMQETWAVYGVYPNMDYSPDGKHLYFWARGKIHKLDVESGEVDHIEFRVKDTRKVYDAPRPVVDVAPDVFQTKMARHTAMSPNGREVVFNALGKLYIRPAGRGKPKRLTDLPEDIREVYPAWSRDGKTLAFTSWDDQDLAKIHTMDVRTGEITTLDLPPGHYARPQFSPAGEFIVFEKGVGGGLRSTKYSNDPGLYIAAVDGSDAVRFTDFGAKPQFGADPLRVFFNSMDEGKLVLKSTNLLGGEPRIHAKGDQVQVYNISPDGKTLVFRENYNIFAMPLLPGPQAIDVSASTNSLPVVKLSENGATYLSWVSEDVIAWSLGPDLYTASVEDAMAAREDEDKDWAARRMSNTLSVKAEKNIPDTTLALTGARVITMASDDGGVLENATIIIEGDRITAIGEDIRIPRGATRIALEGKTIIPGLIDAHAHGPAGQDDLIVQQNSNAMAHLAFGVTTTFNPSSRASEILSFKEMQRAGRVLGPRTFSTGEVIYGAKAPGFLAFIDGYEDALEHVTRLDTQGAMAVKNYNQPRREQRQQVVAASVERDILVVAEGGSLYHMDMSMVADGNSSIEHNLPPSDLYDDVLQMFGQTNVAYTPTLSVTYGGIRGVSYYYDTEDVWKHPILSRHVAPDRLRADTMRRQKAPEDQYADAVSAMTAKKLMDVGVLVSIGAHGEREGLAAHWEMRSFVRGGMSPLQALMTATVNPAIHLGMIDDLGTLEPGKLADMVIVDANPLDDIDFSEKVEHIVQGGRVYEAKTLNEVFSDEVTREPYWFSK